MRPEDFRILLVYPNNTQFTLPPMAIATLVARLRANGYTNLRFFDCSQYVAGEEHTARLVKSLQQRPTDPNAVGLLQKSGCVFDDFRDEVDAFRPDLVLISVLEGTWRQALSLLVAIATKTVPTLIGGVFVTAAPEKAIASPHVRMIGVGEGEQTVVDVAEALRSGRSCEGIPNVWAKRPDGTVAKGPAGRLMGLNGPFPDYSLFHPSRLYRTMGGRLFRMLPVETYRGCPFRCTYCNSSMQVQMSKEAGIGNFLRRKRLDHVHAEIDFLVHAYQLQYIYFIDANFFARPQAEIEAFCEMYSEFKLPFWFNTRPESVTEQRLRMVRDVGCDRMSFGIECGNEEFRRTVLRRNVSNAKLLYHFDLIAKGGIAFSVNNIIGFPDETRGLVFETIELSRQIRGYDTLSVNIFTPFHGTPLRDVAVRKGYLDPDALASSTSEPSLLRMPQLSVAEIDGLTRTFPMYVRWPKERWPIIEGAETDDQVFAELQQQYTQEFLTGVQKVPETECQTLDI